MPNYSLVAGVTYDPLTYQEIAVPVKEAAAYHQALQDKYDELNMTTQMYDRLIDEDDEVARPMFNAFMNNLNTAADALTKGGGWGQRDVFSNLRGSYSKNMMPIQIGFNTRKAEAAEQAKHPELKYSRDAGTTKLGWYVQNPNGGFKVANPATMTAQVATMAKAYLNQLRQNPNGEAAVQLKSMGVDDSMLETIIQYGLPADAIANWRNIPALKAIMSTVLKANGMNMDDNGFGVANETWDANTTNELIEAMSTGLAAGAGQDKVSIQQNPVYAAEQAALRAAASRAGNGTDSISYGRSNDHSWSLDDRFTDKDAVDKSRRVAGALGFTVDDNNNVISPNGVLKSSRYGITITDNNGYIRSMKDILKEEESRGLLPGLVSAAARNPYTAPITALALSNPSFAASVDGKNGIDEIRRIADSAGWRYDTNTGYYYVGNRRATKEDLRAAAQNDIASNTAAYHMNQDITLSSGYNDSFKAQKVYPVKGIGSSKKYKLDYDSPTTIGDILKDKDASVRVASSMVTNKDGIMLEVAKNGTLNYYFINLQDIRDGNIKSAIEDLQKAAKTRANFANGSEYDRRLAEELYNNYVIQLQNSIGGSNTVSAINVNGK